MQNETPFFSSRFRLVLSAFAALFLVLLAALWFAAGWYGEQILNAGHTTSTDPVTVTIGNDRLLLAKNTIRVPAQRQDGESDRVDLYLTWPELGGYGEANRKVFDNPDSTADLIFIQISRSTMSEDISGRFLPIYARLAEGEPLPLRYGLMLHRLKADSGYGKEVVLTGKREGETDFVVRCLLPQKPEESTGNDCQRDIRAGQDLTIFYRFSARLLPQWQKLDQALKTYVEARLNKG